MIAFQSSDTMRKFWFRHDARTNLEITRRIVPTFSTTASDGSSPLAVYDGAVQHSIMYTCSVDQLGLGGIVFESFNVSFDDFVVAKRNQLQGSNKNC